MKQKKKLETSIVYGQTESGRDYQRIAILDDSKEVMSVEAYIGEASMEDIFKLIIDPYLNQNYKDWTINNNLVLERK